jgi:hypothetical protein
MFQNNFFQNFSQKVLIGVIGYTSPLDNFEFFVGTPLVVPVLAVEHGMIFVTVFGLDFILAIT